MPMSSRTSHLVAAPPSTNTDADASSPALTLDLCELTIVHTLRAFLPDTRQRTRVWQLDLHAALCTLGPRASFPIITQAAVWRCLTLSDYYHDFVFTKADVDLLCETLKLWRRRPDWRIADRSLGYCSPDVLVGAVKQGRGDVVREWIRLAIEARIPIRKKMLQRAVRACVRFEQWAVLEELLIQGPALKRHEHIRTRFSVEWIWKCALQAVMARYPIEGALTRMDKLRAIHKALYTADRRRMAEEIAAIGDNEDKRRQYSYHGQPSWRTLMDTLRFMQGVLATALRLKHAARLLHWWFQFDDDLCKLSVDKVQARVVDAHKGDVDAVVRWWYQTHKVRRVPRWTPEQRKQYWYDFFGAY